MSLQIGFAFGVFIAVLLGASMPAFSKIFTSDVYVLNVINGLIPVCRTEHSKLQVLPSIVYAMRCKGGLAKVVQMDR